MNNFLKNGTVLPSGLLTHDKMAMLEGFKKTFQNKTLKAGIVVASYAVTDSNNLSKLFIEYDVLAFEQNEDKGSTVILYKNCAMSSSLGSIADFFEMALRPLEHQTTKGTVPSPSGQDGSIVLLLCLNGMSDTGIIVGSLQHPDRPTTLTTTGPYLQGEYNGVNVVVNTDGSTSLTFKGATDSYGDPTDSSQGNTVVSIATDGSFSVNHSTVTFNLAKSGDVTITAKGAVNVNSTGKTSINAQGDVDIVSEGAVSIGAQSSITIEAQADVTISATGSATISAASATISAGSISLGANASHPMVLGDILSQVFNAHTHPYDDNGSPSVTQPPLVPLSGSALSTVVVTE